MHYGCRELYMTLSCRTVSDPGWRAGRSSHSRLFPLFVLCRRRKQRGKQDMKNRRVYSCSCVFSSISLLYFPVFFFPLPPSRPLPRSICRQYRFTSTVIFWAGFYYGWHKWCKCISFNYATLRDTGVHVVVGFYAFPLVAGSRVFPIFSRSPVTIHVALQRVL